LQNKSLLSSFIFFDLGQTLIDEWDFISYFDSKLLEILNGFGVRIDIRNYQAVRDSIIRDRKIGHGSIKELILEVCRLIAPPGYDKSIWGRLDPLIKHGRKEFFRFFDDAEPTLKALSKYEMGIIANQSEDITDLLNSSGLDKYFRVHVISSSVKMKKPDPKIFELALNQADRTADECVMIGDRLDTDICPANMLGMTTIRTTNSLFALQAPTKKCERADFTVTRLSEIPHLIKRMNV
jgi:putative hydrolase of the HAD superfamily